MAQLRAVLPAPMAQPPRYGLLAAAPTIDDTTNRWQGGFSFAPEQCAGGGTFTTDCDGGTDALDSFENPAVVDGEAFGVFAGDRCSTFGINERDYVGRAQRQLAATESYLIADELWNGGLGLDSFHLTDVSSDTVTDGPASPLVALACVEYALGRESRGSRGMIHVTTALLTHLLAAQVVFRDGQLWTTAMGTIVVADAGYDGTGPGDVLATTSQWMYGTGLISVRLSPVEVLPGDLSQAVDRHTNTVTYVAQRLVALVTDACAHVAAEVNVGMCALDGVS